MYAGTYGVGYELQTLFKAKNVKKCKNKEQVYLEKLAHTQVIMDNGTKLGWERL